AISGVIRPDNTNQIYVEDVNRVITWTATGDVSPVNIYYSVDGSWANRQLIEGNVLKGSGQQIYTWGVVTDDVTSGFDAKIWISDYNDEAVRSESAGFKISDVLTVDNPPAADGDIYRVDETVALQWTSKANSVSNVELWYVNGVVETLIATVANDKGANSWDWTIPASAQPGAASTKSWFRVKDAGDTSVKATGSKYFYIKSNLNITKPGDAAGQVYTVGNPITIEYDFIGDDSPAATVDFYYDKGAGDVWIGQDTNVLSDTGNTFVWANDDNDAVGANVTLKAKAAWDNVNVISSAPNPVKIIGNFTGIELTKSGSPVTAVEVGDSVQVEWAGVGTVPYVKIEYSNDGFGVNIWDITPVSTTNVVGANSYTWSSVDDRISPLTNYWIRVSDVNDPNVVSNTSAAPFKIRGYFTFSPPLSGPWEVETSEPITWTTTGANIGNVDVKFSKDGSIWEDFTPSLLGIANNGNDDTGVSITVPDAITDSFRVRVMDTLDSSVYKISSLLTVKGRFQIDNPTGSTVWKVGDSEVITWTVYGTIANVDLYYWDQPATQWKVITSTTPAGVSGSQASYTWSGIPDLIRDDIKVRVRQVAT
ncbi:MAG: hypothetical protein KAI63_06100, partial [Planctomycetes bacterium]|nr:hypothetical protein [Planctomycetota bacterium]